MATSGTFLFQSPQSEQIITDAYERVSSDYTKVADLLTQQKIDSAQRSINFILSSWVNRGLCLWTVQTNMLALYPNQNTYQLPGSTSDILEATVRTSNRNLGGTPFASSGVAQNAFDNNPATACTQNAADGNIGYGWGAAQYAIAMVGVQSNTSLIYALVFEFSVDNVNWIIIGAPGAQLYSQGVIVWSVINVPTLANYFRIRETGGATLNIQELYFNTALNDTVITRASRSEYISFPQKNTPGRPSNFYVARQINPTVSLYPSPTAQYNNLYYTYIQMPQDIGAMTNAPAISARFLEPLTAALAYKLALKENKLDKLDALKADAIEEFKLAYDEDRERVPLRVFGDYFQGWSQA